MNPSGADYGGRSKLPENLKLLFWILNVSKPDDLIIVEVTLFSEGFLDYKNISQSFMQLMKSCK